MGYVGDKLLPGFVQQAHLGDNLIELLRNLRCLRIILHCQILCGMAAGNLMEALPDPLHRTHQQPGKQHGQRGHQHPVSQEKHGSVSLKGLSAVPDAVRRDAGQQNSLGRLGFAFLDRNRDFDKALGRDLIGGLALETADHFL